MSLIQIIQNQRKGPPIPVILQWKPSFYNSHIESYDFSSSNVKSQLHNVSAQTCHSVIRIRMVNFFPTAHWMMNLFPRVRRFHFTTGQLVDKSFFLPDMLDNSGGSRIKGKVLLLTCNCWSKVRRWFVSSYPPSTSGRGWKWAFDYSVEFDRSAASPAVDHSAVLDWAVWSHLEVDL